MFSSVSLGIFSSKCLVLWSFSQDSKKVKKALKKGKTHQQPPRAGWGQRACQGAAPDIKPYRNENTEDPVYPAQKQVQNLL